MIAAIMRWLERRRRFRAALSYNRDHTFSLCPVNGGSWMCPQCCRIHRSHSSSKFGGPQFNACCDLPAGSRDDRRFAVANC